MKYIINKEAAGITIKDFLKKQKLSLNLVKRLKKLEDGIRVNGNHKTVRYVLLENDVLELQAEDFDTDTNEYLYPVNIPIEIIYEDENITVVNKPYGMPTHQSLNNHDNTLANALMYRYRDKPYVFRATNRLDKDTSGVVITANNRYYASLISNKIKSSNVKKEYICVVSGKLEGEGRIDKPIERIGESIIKREVREDGERALTEYKSLLSCDEISVILVKPVTGRTHQIRVHMSYIGHGIVGDALYNEPSEHISRQALHCLRMQIDDIGDFYAPIPNDIKALIGRYFENEEFLP
ncbi:MAG: RluA family pseudouridine synthase [Clostridia bacterium]|nr:RluA family pseudouridine synthase [Clostridia bacterium]MBP3495313.1 RluA family pseudouridine synthase [Clostridia bacterium]